MEKYIVTPDEMRRAESRCEAAGISCGTLMDNAGSAIAKAIMSENIAKNTVILCGSGNNGGDGFAAAKAFFKTGINCTVILVCGEPKSELAKTRYERSLPYFGRLLDYETAECDCETALKEADIIVDCVYGTGFHGELSEKAARLFRSCNELSAKKYAADIPSGCSAADASVCTDAFRADVTLALGAIKSGEINYPCNKYCGELRLLDIGIPDECYGERYEINDSRLFEMFGGIGRITNKGSFGHLLNIAGSESCIGAAWLSCNAAIRSGVGLVTLASTEKVITSVSSTLHECICLPLKSDGGCISAENTEMLIGAAKKCTAVTVGCGMGCNEDTAKIILSLIKETDIPIIIDADGINSLVGHINEIKDNKSRILITPHPKEFSRISGTDTDRILADKISAASGFAKKYGINVLLKDAYSVLAMADGRLSVNLSGNSGLSKGGSGDTLAGTVGAFAAMGHGIEASARAGAYLLGAAAEKAAEKKHTLGILPSELPALYGEVLKK